MDENHRDKSKILEVINFNKSGDYSIMVETNLTIHNVTQRVLHPSILMVTDETLIAKSQFTVKPADFKIKVLKVLGIKVVSEINVSVDMKFALENTD